MSGLNQFSKEDKILIDTNVLLYVYCPLTSQRYDRYIAHYTDTIQNIVDAKSTVYVNSLIISEFVNRWLRIDFQKSGFSNFKQDYRSSERCKNVLKTILRELKKFYQQCNVKSISDKFNLIDFQSEYMKYPESDFNDLIIAQNAIQYDCKILTQDNDFSQYSVDVLK
jgi:predicted nucleic acid-binding protein